MNYSKLILVGCISAFVAFTTSIMGVAGTIIGSVISSVLYNMLSEALEKPVSEATFSSNFEWEIAYVFPLIVISLIQLLLILSFLSEWGILPHTFLNVYLSIQGLANNNLYRVLGFALLVMSIYPLILKNGIIKKLHGRIIAIVGLIFLARGFVDLGTRVTELYKPIFARFDFPIAVIALALLIYVIYKILMSAKESEKEFKIVKKDTDKQNTAVKQVRSDDFGFKKTQRDANLHYRKPDDVRHENHQRRYRKTDRRGNHNHVTFKKQVSDNQSNSKINKSSDKIQFESNDLLDDYK